MTTPNATTTTALSALGKARSPAARRHALVALVPFASVPAVYDAILTAASADRSPQVRGEAYFQLSTLGTILEDRGIAVLAAAIRGEKSSDARLQALQAAARLVSHPGRHLLARAIADFAGRVRDGATRLEAETVLAKLTGKPLPQWWARGTKLDAF